MCALPGSLKHRKQSAVGAPAERTKTSRETQRVTYARQTLTRNWKAVLCIVIRAVRGQHHLKKVWAQVPASVRRGTVQVTKSVSNAQKENTNRGRKTHSVPIVCQESTCPMLGQKPAQIALKNNGQIWAATVLRTARAWI